MPSPRLHAHLTGLLLALQACGGARAPAPSTDELPGLLAAWHRDPSEAIAAIELDRNPEQQALMLSALIHSGELELSELTPYCSSFTQSAPRELCTRKAERPHLFADHHSRGQGAPTAAVEWPESHCQPAPPEGEDPVAWTARRCVSLGSQQAQAPATCTCLPPGVPQHECWFLCAEGSSAGRGLAGLERALRACSQSGDFAGDCLQHVVSMRSTTLASGVDPLVSLGEASALTQRVLLELGQPRQLDTVAHIFWSLGLAQAADAGRLPGSAGLERLPPEAIPHLRAALAWRLVASGAPLEEEAMLASLERAEIQPTSATWLDASSQPIPSQPRPGSFRWLSRVPPPPDPQGSPSAPSTTVPYLSQGFRLSSSDAASDRQICLLEALVRLRPERARPILEQQANAVDPALAEDARGLLAWLDAGRPAEHFPGPQPRD
jgi:hypothetical protein